VSLKSIIRPDFLSQKRLLIFCRKLPLVLCRQWEVYSLSNPLDIYAAYNAGSVRLLNGKYSNQSNVDNFNKAYSDIQKLN